MGGSLPQKYTKYEENQTWIYQVDDSKFANWWWKTNQFEKYAVQNGFIFPRGKNRVFETTT